jgi:hypothetical protein
MRDETRDEMHEAAGRPAPAAGDRLATTAAGATVSIPPRPGPPVPPLGSTTLHARLALLRPQPVRLRPAPDSEH